jgi:hypothetical protein
MTNPTLETIVAKLQVRRGALDDLPILDPGELGYATDFRRLFIGNDPVTFVGNGSIIPSQLSILVNGNPAAPGIEDHPGNGTAIVFDTAPKTPDVITIKINNVLYATHNTSNTSYQLMTGNYRYPIQKPNWFNTPAPALADRDKFSVSVNGTALSESDYAVEEIIDSNNVKTYALTINKTYIYNGLITDIYNGLITVGFNTEIKTQNSERIGHFNGPPLPLDANVTDVNTGLDFFIKGPLGNNAASIEYIVTIKNTSNELISSSAGNMTIVTDGTVAIVNDSGTSTADNGISFNTIIEGQKLYLTYTNTSEYPAHFYYSIRLWNTI